LASPLFASSENVTQSNEMVVFSFGSATISGRAASSDYGVHGQINLLFRMKPSVLSVEHVTD